MYVSSEFNEREHKRGHFLLKSETNTDEGHLKTGETFFIWPYIRLVMQ